MKVQSMIKEVRHQAGVTILEFIAFIGLAALVIAGALALYQSANSGAKTKEVLEVTNGVVANLRSAAATTGVAMKDLKAGSMTLPTGWTGTANEITKSGKTITWEQGKSGATMLKITFAPLDSEMVKQLQNAPVGGVKCTPTAASLVCDDIPS